MKKLIFGILISLFFIPQAQASHVLGGEISWRCLPNGNFVFYMSVYRDCTGIPFGYSSESLEIFGTPRPRDQNNNQVSSIVLQPDSQRWLNANNGDTSPSCSPLDPTPRLNCADEDPGTVQQFFYVSPQVTLKGTPPASGWNFRWTAPPARPNVENLATQGIMILRAAMYPDKQGSNTYPCMDSSPEFLALPTNLVCRGYTFTYNHTAVDQDLDSLVYEFDRTWNAPASNPSVVPFAAGFNQNKPTPDASVNPNNISCTLDPISGIMTVALYSGVGQPADNSDYLVVVRVNAWRDGVVIASVYREIPFIFFDCPALPSGAPNDPPEVFIDGVPAQDLVTTIVAGQTVRIPFQAKDRNITGITGQGGLQNVTVIPAGFMFSSTLRMDDSTVCEVAKVRPCAILKDRSPTLNTLAQPPQSELTGLAGVATELIWTPGCHHIKTTGTGIPGQNEGIYNFVMRVQDDYCPVPAINYPTITVKVRDPIPLTEPIMKGASIGLDGRVTYSWVPPMDSTFTFDKYRSEYNRPNDGAPALNQFYQPLDVINDYQQSKRNGGFPVYANGANNQPNILNKITGKDYYFRMYTESGCRDTTTSDKSDPVRVIELEATPVGQAPNPTYSSVKLDWNAPKAPNAFSYPYFTYESNTHYYIWENDSVEILGNYIGGEADPDNWYLRGETSDLTYTLSSNVCNGRPAFRIEARDTVITWKEGSAPRQDSLDTLYFSTFSVIDTMFMRNRPGFFPDPVFDTVEVLSNGDINFRIDKGSAGTVARFNIYDNTTNPPTQVASFKADRDSFLLTGYNGGSNVYDFLLESEDECDTNNVGQRNYSTFTPKGKLTDSCSGIYRIGLDNPTGFPNGIDGYRVYVSTDGNNNFELRETVNNPNQDSVDIQVAKNTEHFIKVVAFDNRGDVIIGRDYFPSIDFRTYEVVKAPDLYCTYVEDDGSVTLNFFYPDSLQAHGADYDTTNNFYKFEFQYRVNGGNWQDLPNLKDKSDTEVEFNNVNAFNDFIEFRARSISGCDQNTPSAWTPIISVIDVTATLFPGDTLKRVDVSWNDYGGAAVQQYSYYRKIYDPSSTFTGLDFSAGLNSFLDGSTTSIIDTNSTICGGVGVYHLVTDTTILANGAKCVSRSAPDSALIRSPRTIPMQKIDVVSVNPQTGEIEIYWSNMNGEVVEVLPVEPQGANSFRPLGPRVPWVDNQLTIDKAELDPTDTTLTVSVQAWDDCEVFSTKFDYHTTMDVDVEWDNCDSINQLSWNPYTDFNEGGDDVTYEVYVDAGGTGNFTLVANSETSDSTFKHKITEGGIRYYYYVEATNGVKTFSSKSNVDSDSAFFADEPLFGYMHYATVLPTNEVEISMFKDTVVEQGGYSLYRGTNKRNMNPIERVPGSEVFKQELLTFIDPAAVTDNYSYFYQVITENQCGGAVGESNYGRTIHLTIEADNEALTNTLRWNEYQEWDSTVAYYNIYRGFNGAPAENVYAVVSPTENGDPNIFVDDVYDNTLVDGSYCYKVVAVQGPVTDDFPNELEAATSTSNEVCATQKPLFYIPNAFAPEGKNRMFTPKGQFFDFSLYEMTIYNRWGEQVFITRDINLGWDGTINGEPAPLGSYVYTIRFVDADGEEHRRKGTVTLIR